MKDVIIFNFDFKSLVDDELLKENGYSTIYVQDEESLYNLISKNEKIALVIFGYGAGINEIEYVNIFKKLYEIERVKNVSIITLYNNECDIVDFELREQDDSIVLPITTRGMLNRINRNYRIVLTNRKHRNEIYELLLMYESMTNLVATISFKIVDGFEHHAKEVQIYTKYIAKLYREKYPEKFAERDVNIIETLALLHDIGLLYVDKDVLYHSEKLTIKEELLLRKHTIIGGQLFRTVKTEMLEKYKKTPRLLDKAIELTEYHHERGDGSGYPFGLMAEDIPVFAKIISVAERFSLDVVNFEDVFDIAKSMMSTKDNPAYDQEIVDLVLENIVGMIEVAKSIDDKVGKNLTKFSNKSI